MWTCSLLKENAKQALRGRYWKGFWVCLVVGLLGGGSSSNFTFSYSAEDAASFWQHFPAYLVPFLVTAMVIAVVLAVLWSVFLALPLLVGRCRYFMESRQSPSPFSTVFSVFQTPYLNVVKVSFLTGLKTAVGMFLLIIPGIYWAYCYALVPYLLAENPYLTTTRAMELSKNIMYGEKFHYFLLELSFIGWDLLCIFTFGIGFFFLDPYKSATTAEFYAAMRAKAFSLGLTNAQELGGFVRHDTPNY